MINKKNYSLESLLRKYASNSSLNDYVIKGLLNLSFLQGKKAKPGFSITNKPYPANYHGGFNPDGSGLPSNFDDDVFIDEGISKEFIQYWAEQYFGETKPEALFEASKYYEKFPLARALLIGKGKFIKDNS